MRAKYISPQLATLVDDSFTDSGWLFEEKFDGIRCIAVKKNGKVTLYSRNKKSLNKDFPQIAEKLAHCCKVDFVVDGEIVAFEGKVTSFAKLQSRKQTKIKPYLYLFDLLLLDGENVRSLPLIERKAQLKQSFHFSSPIRYTPHIVGKGESFFAKAKKKGWEGIIAKKKQGIYRSRRTREWLKCKIVDQQEFVIGGFTDPQHSREGFGALLIGYYTKKGLTYAGKVGTGFDHTQLHTLSRRLKSLERKSSPFSSPVKEKKTHWVSPKLVCEVGFTEWTRLNQLRHPRFLGLRKDKSAKQVTREQ